MYCSFCETQVRTQQGRWVCPACGEVSAVFTQNGLKLTRGKVDEVANAAQSVDPHAQPSLVQIRDCELCGGKFAPRKPYHKRCDPCYGKFVAKNWSAEWRAQHASVVRPISGTEKEA